MSTKPLGRRSEVGVVHSAAFLCTASLTLAVAGVGDALGTAWPAGAVAAALALVLPAPAAVGLWMSRKTENAGPGLLHRRLASILLLAGVAHALILICPLDGAHGGFGEVFGMPLGAVAAPLVFPPIFIMAGAGILHRMEPGTGAGILLSLILGGVAAAGLAGAGTAEPVHLIVLSVLTVLASAFLVRGPGGTHPAATRRATLFAAAVVAATLLLAALRG